jgi:hypothetical protein
LPLNLAINSYYYQKTTDYWAWLWQNMKLIVAFFYEFVRHIGLRCLGGAAIKSAKGGIFE